MMRHKKLLLPASLLATIFSGCEQDNIKPLITDYSRGIYIVNEGSFQSNNGSISHFDSFTGSITNGIFEAANGRAVGDVVQSFAIVGDTTGYIVVNGSAKLEIVSLKSFECIAEPIPVTYPRYFLPVNDETGYLTGGSMQGYVYLIDLKAYEVSDSIRVGYGPENMAMVNGLVYVVNSGGWSADSTISVIDVTDHTVTDTIRVGKVPADIAIDASHNLWVYCKGQAVYNWEPPYNLISETEAMLQKIEPASGNILWQGKAGMAGDYTASTPRIAVSPDGGNIFYLRPEGVYKMDAANPAIPGSPVISGNYYGLDINPADGNIFVFEASFTGNGMMKIFDENGNPVTEGAVGIAPNGAVFHND